MKLLGIKFPDLDSVLLEVLYLGKRVAAAAVVALLVVEELTMWLR